MFLEAVPSSLGEHTDLLWWVTCALGTAVIFLVGLWLKGLDGHRTWAAAQLKDHSERLVRIEERDTALFDAVRATKDTVESISDRQTQLAEDLTEHLRTELIFQHQIALHLGFTLNEGGKKG